MSQHDFDIADGPGVTVRSDMNAALQALASTSKGPSRPSTVYAGQLWIDDDTPSSTVWTLYCYDGSGDIEIGKIDTTNDRFSVKLSQAGDVASSSTINLDAAYGTVVDVTGTAAITAATLAQGQVRVVRFTGALTLTHGASLVLPGGANIATAAGDYAIFIGYASSVVRVLYFAGGLPLVAATQAQMEAASSTAAAVTPGRQQHHPSAAKAWAQISYSGGTPSVTAGHNVASLTDSGTGAIGVNLTTAFSSSAYCVVATPVSTGAVEAGITSASVIALVVRNSTFNAVDSNVNFAAFGDQ